MSHFVISEVHLILLCIPKSLVNKVPPLCCRHDLIMRNAHVCFLLALLLLLLRSSHSLDEDTQREVLAVDVLNRSGVLNSLLRSEHHTVLRRARTQRPVPQVPKRAQQGSRFALSLDVPTSILSVLIDLAKNQDMRTKAAANAELMARIGRKWQVCREVMSLEDMIMCCYDVFMYSLYLTHFEYLYINIRTVQFDWIFQTFRFTHCVIKMVTLFKPMMSYFD